jgi:hypothetical protein
MLDFDDKRHHLRRELGAMRCRVEVVCGLHPILEHILAWRVPHRDSCKQKLSHHRSQRVPCTLHQNQSSTWLDGREVPVLKLDPPLSALVGKTTTTLTEQILTELLLFLIGLWPFVAACNSKKRCYVLQSSWNEAFLRMCLEATELVSRKLGFSEVFANAIFEHNKTRRLDRLSGLIHHLLL